MDNKEWFEVYISNEEGSQTIQNCATLEEARGFKSNYKGNKNLLHIDKWRHTDNPELLRRIE